MRRATKPLHNKYSELIENFTLADIDHNKNTSFGFEMQFPVRQILRCSSVTFHFFRRLGHACIRRILWEKYAGPIPNDSKFELVIYQ